MATQEQIRRIFQKMSESHPKEFFHHMDETQAGIGAVLRLLYMEEKPVTAGKISDTLGISTARVAVLLRKMESKGLIIKEKNPLDARVTIVSLTDMGTEMIKDAWKEIQEQMGKIIDTVGEERLLEYIEISNEIRQVVSPPKIAFWDK